MLSYRCIMRCSRAKLRSATKIRLSKSVSAPLIESLSPAFVSTIDTLSSSSFQSKSAFSSSSSSTQEIQSSINNKAQERLGHLMQMYEDFVGLTEVKDAQNKVVSAEQKYMSVQEDRRTLQAELLTVQSDVRAVAAELEKTSRTDSRYIDLVKREHEALLVERDMAARVKTLDKAERDLFGLLSAALRESHEKERARAERTKYWSVIGSIVGAVIGIVGSTINNVRRMRELRSIVTESGENTAEYKSLVGDALQAVVDQQARVDELIQSLATGEATGDTPTNLSSRLSVGQSNTQRRSSVSCEVLDKQTAEILESLERHSASLSSRVQEVAKLVSVGRASDDVSQVVYAGPEIESMLAGSEVKVETEVRKHIWCAAAAVSGVVTLGVVVVSFITRGGGS